MILWISAAPPPAHWSKNHAPDGVNPLAHQAKRLRRQPFRQAAGAFLLLNPAAQQGVDIRLGVAGFRFFRSRFCAMTAAPPQSAETETV
jgi:hypothetical protein